MTSLDLDTPVPSHLTTLNQSTHHQYGPFRLTSTRDPLLVLSRPVPALHHPTRTSSARSQPAPPYSANLLHTRPPSATIPIVVFVSR